MATKKKSKKKAKGDEPFEPCPTCKSPTVCEAFGVCMQKESAALAGKGGGKGRRKRPGTYG